MSVIPEFRLISLSPRVANLISLSISAERGSG
jgi:hypothetical protein